MTSKKRKEKKKRNQSRFVFTRVGQILNVFQYPLVSVNQGYQYLLFPILFYFILVFHLTLPVRKESKKIKILNFFFQFSI